MNLTVIWRFLLGACEIIHIFIRGGGNYHNYAENIRRHRTKFHRPGDQAPGISVLLRTTSEQSIQVTADRKTRNSNKYQDHGCAEQLKGADRGRNRTSAASDDNFRYPRSQTKVNFHPTTRPQYIISRTSHQTPFI